MTNALLQQAIINSTGPGYENSADHQFRRTQQRNALIGQQNQQTTFQQGQEDRQAKMALEQDEARVAPIRADWATFLMQPAEQRQQTWAGGFAQHYGMDANTDWRQGLQETVRKNPRLFPKELTDKIFERELAPKAPDGLPNSAQEFEYARRGGYRGSYQDWMREQKTQTQQFRVDNPTQPKPKALPNPAVNRLFEAGTDLETQARLGSSFKDEFGGHAILGDLDNTIGRIAGDDTGQAQWWQDYQSHVNEVRNRLFGSALTLPEKAEFYKAMITPRMEAGEIRKNLTRQNEIADRAARKLAKSYAAMGYSQEAIDELVPPSAAAPPADGGGATTITSDEEYDALPSGAAFIDPEGNERVKP